MYAELAVYQAPVRRTFHYLIPRGLSLAVGQLVEKSIPALVVPRGQMKTNLLGMSFLDRLESWGVQADRLKLHGYPDVTGSINTGSSNGSGSHRRGRPAVN